MIKVVSFDIGGTLLRENNDVSKYNLNALSNLIGLPKDVVKNAYKDVFQKTKGSFKKLVKDFCNKLNIKETQELIDFFKQKFNNTFEQLDSEDIELLKTIKNKGYKVILFSNNCCLVKSTLKNSLKDIVDNIFYSYDLGYTKSDEESFRFIEKKLHCQASEFLHIGDTLKSDYLKPISYGWNALFYGISDEENIKCISNLSDVLKYLD